MKMQVLGALALALFLVGCSDSGTSPSNASSGTLLSSNAMLSSGAVVSSGTLLSSGAVASSSSVAEGAIPGLAISEANGHWWVVGQIQGTQAPDAVTGVLYLNGAAVSASKAEFVLGTSVSAYVIKPSVNILDIPLSGSASLDAEVVWGDNACAGNYQLEVTVSAAGSVKKDTTEYNYDYGLQCP